MSDIPADPTFRGETSETGLNIEELVARIQRSQEETRKFVSEQHKLNAEANKFAAEQAKLFSEARKLDRDRGLAPWQASAITVGSIAALVASLVSLAKSMGWLG